MFSATAVRSIGDNTFQECSSLSVITLPIAVRSIGDNAFEKCLSLKDIIVPAACTSIGSGAFRECSGLSRVELPAAIKKIEGNAFAKCAALLDISIGAPKPPVITSSTFKGLVTNACRLTVPRGAKSNYQKDKSWKKFSLISEQN